MSNEILKIILPVIILILVADLVCGFIYLKTKGKLFKWLYHDIYHWHIPDETMGFDGLSFTSHCKICGKKIMQDSQGNWF